MAGEKKWRRNLFSKVQTLHLEYRFRFQKYLYAMEGKRLASMFNLPPNQVIPNYQSVTAHSPMNTKFVHG